MASTSPGYGITIRVEGSPSLQPVALVAIDEEFFMLIRVLGSHITMFLSDVTCALFI